MATGADEICPEVREPLEPSLLGCFGRLADEDRVALSFRPPLRDIIVEGGTVDGQNGVVTASDRTVVKESLFRGRHAADRRYSGPSRRATPRVYRGTAIPLVNFSGELNFYTWLIDTLPRAAILWWGGVDAVIVRRGSPQFYVDSIRLLASLYELEVVWIDPDEEVRADRLRWASAGPAERSGLLHPVQYRFIKDLFFRGYAITPSCTRRRIYVTRAGASCRRVANESDLISAMRAFGVEVIDPSRMTFAEQVATFCESALVIGPHGAGLSNLVFLDRGLLLELLPESWHKPHYVGLAAGLGIEYRALVGSARCRRTEDFAVSVAAVQDLLAPLMACDGELPPAGGSEPQACEQ